MESDSNIKEGEGPPEAELNGYWIPETPAKTTASKLRYVYSRRDVKGNSRQSFLPRISEQQSHHQTYLSSTVQNLEDSGESENGLPGAELVAEEVEAGPSGGENGLVGAELVGEEAAAGPSGGGEYTFDRLVDTNACSNDVARHLDFFSIQESNEYHFDDLNLSFQDSTTAITETTVNWCCSQESTTSFQAPPKLENVKNTESHAKPCYGEKFLQSDFISLENKKLQHSVGVFEPTTPSLKPSVNERPQRKPSKKSKVKKRRYRPKIAVEVIPKRTIKNPVEKNLKRKYVKKSQSEKKNKRKKLSANSSALKTIEDDPVDMLKPMVKGLVIDQDTMQQNNIRKNIVSKNLLGDFELDTDTLKWMTLRRRSPRDCQDKKFCCHLYQVGCRCIPSLSLIGSHSVSSSGSHQLEVDRIKLAFPGICKRRRIRRQRKSILSIILSFLHLQCNFVKKKRSKGLFARRNLASLVELPMCNKMPDLNEIIGGTKEAEKDLMSNPIEKQEVINTEEQWIRNSKGSDTKIRLSLQLASTNSKDPKKVYHKKVNVNQRPKYTSVRILIRKFSTLTINNRCTDIVPIVQRQKVRKVRGEVDMDLDTSRMWSLLLKLSGGRAEEKIDEEEEKKWEETRKIFRGRIDSFTSKMHMILGDRRFRPWKGSVVDSVIGVFLTQNVTDFLSSSTYMELASKFPIQPTSHDNESQYFVTQVEENYGNESNSENELALTVAEASVMNKWIGLAPATPKPPKGKAKKRTDWNILRTKYSRPINSDQADSVDWEAVRTAPVEELANIIEGRGQHRVLAKKIQDFLDREVEQTGTINLEWLRYAPPDDAKEYLLEIAGIGLKSVECLRLLTLHHKAFPVDTNVARISTRLGWIPLQPLPGVQFHRLEEYPLMDKIQQYLWPRLCTLDHQELYELHYHMITFGKVFCTKLNPNCRSCPMRAECRHLASEIASKNLSLPSSSKKDEERSIVPCTPVENSGLAVNNTTTVANPIVIPFLESNTTMENGYPTSNCKPIIEEPKSPKTVQENEHCGTIGDIEDFPYDEEGIPTIKLSNEAFQGNVQYFMDKYWSQVDNPSRALVPRSIHVDSVPLRKLKQTTHLRTEHLVYELPDGHELVKKLRRRDRDDLFPYLLAIWTPGETADSWEMPERECNSQVSDSETCGKPTCFPCQSFLEANANIVRGTILVPIRTALKAKFPLNGTYFQVNEVFADHETSKTPLIVNRDSIGNLKRRTVYFGTSATSIFRRNCSIRDIQENFWKGFICVRAWDSKTGAPKALSRRFHCPPSKMDKKKRGANKKSRDNAEG